MRDRLPPLPVLTLIGWTLLVWMSRARTVVDNGDLSTWGTSWRIGVVVVFLALASLAARDRMIGLFVAWTIVYWVVRGGGLLITEHSIGFKAIHTVLMVVSIGLAMWVWRSRNR